MEQVLSIFAERRTALFGISDEYWNFSVYRYVSEEDGLVCIACRRDKKEDEDEEHRRWEPGEGHVGLSFSRATEIIFSDATKPELRPVLEAKGTNSRGYDSSRYVSLASMPISTDGSRPLGVLIATSDKLGRFKNDNERGERDWESADTLREVASNLAIIFQLIHAQSNDGGSKK